MVHSSCKISTIDAPNDVSKQSIDVNSDKHLRNRKNTDSEIVTETKAVSTRLYKRRWYILAIYSLVTFTQACIWNTFGPIAVSCEKAFGWNVSIIALLPNWGPIGFIIAAWVTSWSIDVQGIRYGCVVTSVLFAVAAAIRCITSEPPYITWTANIAALLNGLGGPVAMGVPPALSAAWFPPYQRTTATAIGTAFNYAGVAVSFLIGPLFVPESETSTDESYNTSTLWNTTSTPSLTNVTLNTTFSPNHDAEDVTRIRHQVMIMMYTECGWCVLVLVLVLLYFPSKPPMPPSNTASEARMDMMAGIKALIRNRLFLMLNVIYGVPLGILSLWASVLDVNLKSHDISESQAGWIGFYSIIAGCAGSLVMARFSDVFAKHIKQLLILLFSFASVCFLWFNLIVNGYIPNSIAQIYISVILGTLLMNASVPLIFEMACENTYPIAEGITTVVLTTWLNVIGLIFLGVQMVPGIGTAWENWSILASIVVCIPVLFLMHDQYNRLNVDEKTMERSITINENAQARV